MHVSSNCSSFWKNQIQRGGLHDRNMLACLCMNLWPQRDQLWSCPCPSPTLSYTRPRNKPPAWLLPPPSRLLCGMLFPPTRNWGHTKGTGLGVRHGFECWLCHFSAVWRWAGYSNLLTLLNLGFIICSMEGNSPIWPETCWEHEGDSPHWTDTLRCGTGGGPGEGRPSVWLPRAPRGVQPRLFREVVPWLRQLSPIGS